MKAALPDGSEAGAALASLAPLLFVALWSTGFIGAKLGLPYVEPLTFLALRFVIVIVLMSAVAVLVRAPWPPLGMRWVHIGVSGLLVHGVYLGGVFTAIGHGLPSGTTALVVGLQPILTALAAGTLLGERVRPAQWMGLVLGFAGVALVVAGKAASVPGGALVTMLMPALVALLGITAGTLYQKRFAPPSTCARARSSNTCPAWSPRRRWRPPPSPWRCAGRVSSSLRSAGWCWFCRWAR